MIAGGRITDKDNGYLALAKAIGAIKRNAVVKVGVDGRSHTDSDLDTDQIGAIHEFGSGSVPQRSFLRGWVDDNTAVIKEGLTKAVKKAIWGGGGGLQKGLEDFGEMAVTGVKTRILDFIPPPLADSTVERKGSDIPLIDTHELIEAIIYEVET